MLTKRIIACMDVRDGQVVKGVQFQQLRHAGDPAELAGGIGQALITTAAGLVVAIPSLYCYRYFSGHVEDLVVTMEQEALKLVEVLQGQREEDAGGRGA